MSELINTRDSRATIRWKLLASASALALLSSVNAADAADTDRPLIWIEYGGQAENISGQGEVFAPAFLSAYPDASVIWNGVSPLQAQKPPVFTFGQEGRISFQPEGSDWVFSAAIRYGRSNQFRHVDHQTTGAFHEKYHSGIPQNSNPQGTNDFADTQVHRGESNTILDFSVGKDVGLGLFGGNTSSTVNLGVRFAQFTSRETFDIRARPDLQFKYANFGSAPGSYITLKLPHFHNYHATGLASRQFRGVGPSLSWNGSTPFVGNEQDGELTFDWGANAGILFGKQKARAQHQETAQYVSPFGVFQLSRYQTVYQNPVRGHSNVRNVTVPNVGGSVGLSWRIQDFKVSMGYRADFFFGAMDTGIDAAKKSDLTFNGPYASISIGLGD